MQRGRRLDRRGFEGQARGPHHGGHRQLLFAGAGLQADLLAAHLEHPAVAAQAHIPPLQGTAGLFPVEGPGLGQGHRALFDQLHHRRARQHVGQLAGQFHAAGTGPHDRQALQGLAPLAQLLHQGLQPFHVRQAAEADGVFVHPGDAEALQSRSRGQHQLAVGELAPGGGVQEPVAAVDLHHRIPQPGDAAAGQQGVVAGGDLPAAQFAAQQLIQQGQKQKFSVGLDQQQGGVLPLFGQGQGGVEPTESATHDGDRRGELTGALRARWSAAHGLCGPVAGQEPVQVMAAACPFTDQTLTRDRDGG